MMRIRTTLVAMLLLMIGAVNANATKVKADLASASAIGNAAWDNTTNTFSWTAPTYAFMVLPGLSGNLTDYTSLVIETENFIADSPYRIDFELGDGSTLARIEGTVFYSAGTKTMDLHSLLTPEQLADVKAVRLNTNSDAGSIVLKKAYLVKPFVLTFDQTGKAVIGVEDLLTTGGFSLDEETGVLTSTCSAEVAGSLGIALPSEGVDMTGVYGFKINYEGSDNIISNFNIANAEGEWSKGFWSSVYGRNDLAAHLTSADNVNSWVWNSNGTAGTITISSIELYANVISASNAHEMTMSKDMFKTWDSPTLPTTGEYMKDCAYDMNISSGLPYGHVSVVYTKYADLSAYSKLIVTVSAGEPRFCFNRVKDGGQDNEEESLSEMIDIPNKAWGTAKYQTVSGNTYTIDLAKMVADKGFAHLHCIKGRNGNVTVTGMTLIDDNTAFDYVMNGSGMMTDAAKEALADASATAIDATGLANAAAIDLATANPNCLIVAKTGMVKNENNVVVDGVCASLSLSDGYPFAAPADFEATKATYTTTVGDSKYATLCLPYATQALPAGVKAYDVTGTDGAKLTATEAVAIAANRPVLLQNAGTHTFTAENCAVTKDATTANGVLTGTYKEMEAAAGSYVLQSQNDVVAFYLVGDVKPAVKPFRAYLSSDSEAKMISIDFDTPTGISSMEGQSQAVVKAYNMAGQAVSTAKGGLTIQKMSDGTVRKMIIK